jgi:PBP1b-binding outer membrane lipoprotein LpoB
MKKIIFILLFSAVAWNVKAQNSSERPAESMIRQFYVSYIATVAVDDIPVMNAKIKALLTKNCTQKFIDKLPKLTEKLDADPIIRAQDSDTAVLKTLAVKRNLKKQNAYTVSYSFKNLPDKPAIKTNIYLTVVNQNGIYKIDDILIR